MNIYFPGIKRITPEIIRLGDPTSHDGKVIEGSPSDLCHGKPIAYIGHKVHCPKCKGTYPIIEGVQTTTFYGKGVAVAGMKTSCGATLIATQFTDTVEWGGGDQSSSTTDTATQSSTAEESALSGEALGENDSDMANGDGIFDLRFLVVHERTKQVVRNTPYRILLDDGKIYRGVTDENGYTENVSSDAPRKATLEVPYYDNCDTDPTVESNACGC